MTPRYMCTTTSSERKVSSKRLPVAKYRTSSTPGSEKKRETSCSSNGTNFRDGSIGTPRRQIQSLNKTRNASYDEQSPGIRDTQGGLWSTPKYAPVSVFEKTEKVYAVPEAPGDCLFSPTKTMKQVDHLPNLLNETAGKYNHQNSFRYQLKWINNEDQRIKIEQVHAIREQMILSRDSSNGRKLPNIVVSQTNN